MVDDVFLLASRALNYAPGLLLGPGGPSGVSSATTSTLTSLLDTASLGLLLQHREACCSVLAFLVSAALCVRAWVRACVHWRINPAAMPCLHLLVSLVVMCPCQALLARGSSPHIIDMHANSCVVFHLQNTRARAQDRLTQAGQSESGQLPNAPSVMREVVLPRAPLLIRCAACLLRKVACCATCLPLRPAARYERCAILTVLGQPHAYSTGTPWCKCATCLRHTNCIWLQMSGWLCMTHPVAHACMTC